MTEQLLEMLREIQPYEEINQDTLLLDEGILDSLTMVEFIVEIEDKFLVDIPERMITEENFQKIETIENQRQNPKITGREANAELIEEEVIKSRKTWGKELEEKWMD